MKDVNIKYIKMHSRLFDIVKDLRFEVLFKPYNKIHKYTYDDLDESSYHLVAVDGEKVVGYSRMTNINGKGKITNVFVIPQYENMKIGHKMLAKHIEKAKSLKINQLYLNARTSTINFYRKAGFVEQGEIYISDKSGLKLQNMIMIL